MDLNETVWKVVKWIHLVWDKVQWQTVMNMIMNLWVPWKVDNFFSSSWTI
jgi:hypothetical protein